MVELTHEQEERLERLADVWPVIEVDNSEQPVRLRCGYWRTENEFVSRMTVVVGEDGNNTEAAEHHTRGA